MTSPAVDAVTIVPMRRRHLRGVLRIERHSEHSPWSAGLFLNELRGADRCYRTALEGSTVVGYAGMLLVGPDAHVTTVTVRSDRRRRGIGARLVEELVAEAEHAGAEAMTLEVAAGNAAAIALYERAGFHVEGVRRQYYAELGQDALIMWRTSA